MIEIHFGWLIGIAVFAFMNGQIYESLMWKKKLKSAGQPNPYVKIKP